MSMEEKVVRSITKTLDQMNMAYLVCGEHGELISNDFPIEALVRALKAMEADFEIRYQGEHYINKERFGRNMIYRELIDVFAEIKPGEMVMVKIPEHLDFEKARASIVNHFRRRFHPTVNTHKVGNSPDDRRLQVYVAPIITEEEKPLTKFQEFMEDLKP
jgi:hypothetical protein